MNSNHLNKVLAYMIGLRESNNKLDHRGKIEYIAKMTGITKTEIQGILYSDEFLTEYQKHLLSHERLMVYEEALDKQIEIMRKAHYKTSLEATKEIIARGDREFYKNEYEKQEAINDGLVDLLTQLKREDDNE